MDETKIVFSKEVADVICHEDGLVEINMGKHSVQISHTDFEMIYKKRMEFMWRSKKRVR
jgi:hypothetical protein